MAFPCQQLIPLACPPLSWVHAWGALNLNNQTDGALYPFVAESSGLGVASIALARVPIRGAKLRWMSFLFRTVGVAVNTNWIVQVDSVDSVLQLPILAGAITGSVLLATPLIIPAGEHNIAIRFTAAAPPGAATTRPIILVGGDLA